MFFFLHTFIFPSEQIFRLFSSGKSSPFEQYVLLKTSSQSEQPWVINIHFSLIIMWFSGTQDVKCLKRIFWRFIPVRWEKRLRLSFLRLRLSFNRFRTSFPYHCLSFSASVKLHFPELLKLLGFLGTKNKDSVKSLSGKEICGAAVFICFLLVNTIPKF